MKILVQYPISVLASVQNGALSIYKYLKMNDPVNTSRTDLTVHATLGAHRITDPNHNTHFP